MLKILLLICGAALSAALLWFAVSNYRAATPIAQENLRGMALSITAAVENIAAHDQTLRSLDTLRPNELAFLAVVDRNGSYRFHSNPDLIGLPANDPRYADVLRREVVVEGRVTLGTGVKSL
ncbi:hypothetical protein OR1_03172 [Geobacter sp. OR-1]|uniref:hypothetical protein n=1 Tax=Geobacter sp. OR-1 TaxID=1266765 RepID=UPI0005434ECA|nr:hypothetical protein [Geobacter sp. OR-1]GAM10872.1 hypothetical protein OR1_03172 [Geobacter sp. OR-1]